MADNTESELDPERAFAALLDVAWVNIAASGWNRYQLYGKGALLASMQMLEGKSHNMDYITASPEAPLPEWLETVVSSYDPQTSVVVVFVADEVYRRATRPASAQIVSEQTGILSGLAYFRVGTRTPTPPECAKSLAH